MKVAVVTMRAVDGAAGGAERFYEALVAAFRQQGHDAQELPIIGDEANFDHIERNYLASYDLDVSAFDMVVSTKAPTWLVRHPRHICYLVHTIRVFYDMFDSVFSGASVTQLEQRRLIHSLDTGSLSSPRCKSIFTIGNEVSKRLRDWNGLDSTVAHPPLWTNAFHAGQQGDYLLLPGRLHAWKRVDLIIRAVRLMKAPLRLIITGTGEAERELRELAAGDPRIEFRGRVGDSELVELYANALAVPFTPMHEDYGYVTLEAFASGKPVVTCADSGEAAAIVEASRGGLVCAPDPAAVADTIEHLWNHRELARQQGDAGAVWVRSLTWPNVVAQLIDSAFA